MKKKSDTISVRLKEETAERLDEVATAGGLSRGKYVESIVDDVLHGGTLRNEIIELKEQIREFHGAVQGMEGQLSKIQLALEQSNSATASQIAEFNANLRGLRSDFRTATMALLCDAGKAEPEEAEQFVRENMPMS